MLEVLDINRRKARKQYVCSVCGKTIEAGEEYECQTIVNDGEIYSWRQCDRCKPYVDELWSVGFDGYYSDGMTSSDFIDFMWGFHPEVIGKWYGFDGDNK